MHTQELTYHDGDTTCVGYIAYDDSHTEKRPVVLICHAFEGRNELACSYARKCAEQGYVGFAVDMYGDAAVADTLEGCMGHLMPFFEDRSKLRARILAAFHAVQQIDTADTQNIAAMGFCFGGMTVLDLARSGADVKAVASVHGVFAAPEGVEVNEIKAKVLCLHGYKDPQVPPEALAPFAEEMDQHGVDWQVHYFGNAKHAFTDPHAAEIGGPEMGREYNEAAANASWDYSMDLFAKCFN